VTRTSSYPTEDRLNFTGIDFPTPVSQINKLDKENLYLAISGFWLGRRTSGAVLRQRKRQKHSENQLDADPERRKNVLHIHEKVECVEVRPKQTQREQALLRSHGYQRKELLERHKTECIGHLKCPTRTEMPKEGENKVRFKDHHKQMKAPFVVYVALSL